MNSVVPDSPKSCCLPIKSLSEHFVTANPSTTVGKAIELMLEENSTVLLVLSNEKQLVGTISDAVVLRAAVDSHLRQDPLSLHMVRKFASVASYAPLDVVLDQFVLHDLQFLAVVDEAGAVAGVITRTELMRAVFGCSKITIDA